MKKINFFKLIMIFILYFSTQNTVYSKEMVCKITDPTDTSLNIRSSPNGKITNHLRNGREVYIKETAYDDQGRLWALIAGMYDGKYRLWGWAFREFISCYSR